MSLMYQKFLKMEIVKILILLIIFSITQCSPDDKTCGSDTIYANMSNKRIKIINYLKGGTIGNIKVIENKEFYTLSRSNRSGACPSIFFLTSTDSITITFDDSIKITQGSKLGIDSCNGRNLLCANSFVKTQIDKDYNEFTYTFTEADYEFAKNR